MSGRASLIWFCHCLIDFVANKLSLLCNRAKGSACATEAVNLTSVCAYGGGPMGEQLSALKKGLRDLGLVVDKILLFQSAISRGCYFLNIHIFM